MCLGKHLHGRRGTSGSLAAAGSALVTVTISGKNQRYEISISL